MQCVLTLGEKEPDYSPKRMARYQDFFLAKFFFIELKTSFTTLLKNKH